MPHINAETAAQQHYAEAEFLAGQCGAWLPAAHRIQDRNVSHVLAMAQVEATLAVADELRALRVALQSNSQTGG